VDIIDSLLGVLPVVFAVIWVLSRLGRARKTNKSRPSGKQAVGTPGGSEETTSSRQSPEKAPASGSVAEWLAEKARQVRDGAERIEDGKKAFRGEEELYERLETRKVEPSPHRIPQPAAPSISTKRIVDDVVSPYATDGKAEREVVFDRIADLPPLAQGVLWSVILDEPPALKGPHRR
jgi:hypothetical protein